MSKTKSKKTLLMKPYPEIDSGLMEFLPDYLCLICMIIVSID